MPSDRNDTPSPGFPIIDFASLLAGDVECRAVLRGALLGGAFYLKNHGVSEALLARLLRLTADFYALPFEERMRVAATPETLGGYQPRDRFNETFFATMIRERTSGIDYTVFGENRWPQRPAGITDSTVAFIDAMGRVTHRLIGALALAAGLGESDFDSLFGPTAVHGAQLRYYAPQRPPFEVLLDKHSDPNALALIVQDDIGGLEGLVDGEWRPMSPVPGTIVCTVGEVLAAWTNDRIAASLHRVVHDMSRGRFSLVYTLVPRLDAPMDSFAACCEATRPSRYPSITFSEFLIRYIAAQAQKGPDQNC